MSELSSHMPGLAILIAKARKGTDSNPDVKDLGSSPHSEEETVNAIMKAFITAVHEKDVAAAVQSFKDLSELCESTPDEEMSEGEPVE